MDDRASGRARRNRGVTRRGWFGAWAVAAAIAATFPAAAAPVYYQETGDAGDYLHPQAIGPAGSVFNGIQGTIGGTDDPVDAFSFFYGGGNLWIQTIVGDPAGPPSYISASLWAIPPDPFEPPDAISPTGGDATIGLVGFGNLAAGNYIVQFEKAGSDPPFTATFVGPTTGDPPAEISAPVPVPEPGGLPLVALGMLALEIEAIARRRRDST
jgi:hypothetical protein